MFKSNEAIIKGLYGIATEAKKVNANKTLEIINDTLQNYNNKVFGNLTIVCKDCGIRRNRTQKYCPYCLNGDN